MAWNKYRHCVNHVNSNWKLTVIFLSLFCLLPINGQDFQFETNTDDDLHVSRSFNFNLHKNPILYLSQFLRNINVM